MNTPLFKTCLVLLIMLSLLTLSLITKDVVTSKLVASIGIIIGAIASAQFSEPGK